MRVVSSYFAMVAIVAYASTVRVADAWEYRLGGSFASATSGRLEARASTSDSWGTVCDDAFGSNDAIVACRSLGLGTIGTTYATASSSQQGTSYQPIVMDDLECTGSEARLNDCTFTGASREDCRHSEDIIITCGAASWEYRLAGPGATSTYGRLEARAGTSAPWGTVCDDSFGTGDAEVACRSLGFGTSSASYETAIASMRGTSNQPIVMDDLACSGSENRLDQCPFVGQSREDCSHGEDVVLTCGASGGWQYRLAGGFATPTSGRLEVRQSTADSWGTVCDDNFGRLDAEVACRSLGLAYEGASYSSASSSQQAGSSTPTNMDDLGCSGSENALNQCPYVGSNSEDCNHSEDIILSCVGSWEYRLAGPGATSSYGRLEARQRATDAWGTVCDDSFSSVDAAVACRSVGYTSSTSRAQFSTATGPMQGSSTQPIVMDDVYCSGTEGRLDQCAFIGQSREDCSHSEDVVVHCDGVSPASPTRSSSSGGGGAGVAVGIVVPLVIIVSLMIVVVVIRRRRSARARQAAVAHAQNTGFQTNVVPVLMDDQRQASPYYASQQPHGGAAYPQPVVGIADPNPYAAQPVGYEAPAPVGYAPPPPLDHTPRYGGDGGAAQSAYPGVVGDAAHNDNGCKRV